MIKTAPITLRPWSRDVAPAFAALHADSEVMADRRRWAHWSMLVWVAGRD
jgi:hypothetical protein